MYCNHMIDFRSVDCRLGDRQGYFWREGVWWFDQVSCGMISNVDCMIVFRSISLHTLPLYDYYDIIPRHVWLATSSYYDYDMTTIT